MGKSELRAHAFIQLCAHSREKCATQTYTGLHHKILGPSCLAKVKTLRGEGVFKKNIKKKN